MSVKAPENPVLNNVHEIKFLCNVYGLNSIDLFGKSEN